MLHWWPILLRSGTQKIQDFKHSQDSDLTLAKHKNYQAQSNHNFSCMILRSFTILRTLVVVMKLFAYWNGHFQRIKQQHQSQCGMNFSTCMRTSTWCLVLWPLYCKFLRVWSSKYLYCTPVLDLALLHNTQHTSTTCSTVPSDLRWQVLRTVQMGSYFAYTHSLLLSLRCSSFNVIRTPKL